MELHRLPGDIRIEAPFPVEIPVSADGKKLRVAIEWPVIEHFLGPRAAIENDVREMLQERREQIVRIVKAHLFAHGFPVDGTVTLEVDDFRHPGTEPPS